MKSKAGIVAVTVFLLTGCGATWINLDGSKAELEKINTAKSRCNHDSTLLSLQASEVKKDASVIATSSVAKKKELEEAYDLLEKETLARLNGCMSEQGLKPLH